MKGKVHRKGTSGWLWDWLTKPVSMPVALWKTSGVESLISIQARGSRYKCWLPAINRYFWVFLLPTCWRIVQAHSCP